VQELDELIGASTYLLHLRGLLDSIEIVTHVVNATARRRDNVIEAGEVANKQRLRVGRFCIEPAVCRRLSAACLIARIHDLVAKALQQLEACDANLWKESIDVAWDEKSDTHPSLLAFKCRR
jgi:hypothetical protein